MGNQQSGGHLHPGGGGGQHAAGGPHDTVLESMQKEADRDAHLANLDHSQAGFKRSKSLRKSISKRILRRQSKSSSKNLEGPPPEPEQTEPLEAEVAPVASPAARDVPDTGGASIKPTQAANDPAVDRTVVTTVLTLPPSTSQPSHSTSSPSLEKLREGPSEQQPSLKSTHSSSTKKLTAGEPQPFPTHIQVVLLALLFFVLLFT